MSSKSLILHLVSMITIQDKLYEICCINIDKSYGTLLETDNSAV